MLQQSLQNKLQSFFSAGEAIANPIIEEKAYTEALSAEEYQRKSRWTMYGKAYNRAADAKYASDGALEARMKAAELAAQYQYDPDGFSKMFQAASAPSVASAPTPELKVALQKSYNDYGARQYEKILSASYKKGRDNQAKSYSGYLEMLKADYLSAVSNNDEEAAVDTMSNILNLQNSAIKNKFVSDGEVASYNRMLLTDAYSTREMSLFNDSEDPIKYLTEFKKRDHAPLNEKQQDELYSKMMTTIKSDNALQRSIDDEENRLKEEERQNKLDELDTKWITRGISQMELDQARIDGVINQADYEKYSEKANDNGAKFTSTETVLRMTTYFADYTERDIYDATDITNEDKVKLIASRKDYLEKGGKWTSTIQGAEARDRVRRKFNIVSDTLMASIDFTGKTMREFDETYRAFFDRVQQLPIEEREVNALRIADEVIGEYNSKKRSEKEQRAKIRKAEEERKLKEAEAAYKNSAMAKFVTSIGQVFEGDPDALDE
jgi:hypothetical protein